MRLPDFWTGLGFAAVGIAIAVYAQGFHVPAGAASPRLLPTIIGSFMALFGCLIALRGWREAGNVALPGWLSSPRQLALVVFLPVAVIAYGLLAPRLGSSLVTMMILTLHGILYGLRPLYAIVLGVCAGIAVTFLFIHVLGIPLPAGWIEELLS
ncbi:MAG: tripartite tricarboxylate transporter TctB family protein [Alphaproteobacteria bacterium]|nr:tripartite tricarboxylate transporter TctB family protein [Alphaproteobacteria bacterium]MBU1553154.1 tripartite tricarboxylate transporter TctB family protein [Alphaproteobacteria bacterium]MBU2338129.1 tripartite tricarboxylate transporter TctB family protein [Alphaproteobacteria bacterium]MBU2386682.1 tripartite tricarboxylate transporter TctB family protein [Alphaproteobacteria bacterium]|tara:strand:+ start:454 stop:915 length:462 start_codon:yes stop_codon:yes gene_type:complete